jgi:hypothetical protein
VLTNVALLHRANRQQEGRKLRLGQIAQDVTLVLLVVRATNEEVFAATFDDLGVVAGRHPVKTQPSRSIEEQVELDVAIALNTGIRGLALGVGRHERCDDVTFELVGVIEDVMINVEHLGNASRIIDVRDGATARVRHSAPQFQGGADDLVTLLEE